MQVRPSGERGERARAQSFADQFVRIAFVNAFETDLSRKALLLRRGHLRENIVDPILLIRGDDRQMIRKLNKQLVKTIAEGFDQGRVARVKLGLIEAEQERAIVRSQLAQPLEPAEAQRVDLLRR